MQGIGLYFDITQATQTPQGPLGISILAWGSLLFGVFAVSTIGQLWWHIRKYEDSYEYALSFEGIRTSLTNDKLQIALVFKNTIDRPLAFQVESTKTYAEVEGATASSSSAVYIIPIGGSSEFRFIPLKAPHHSPIAGEIVYELIYGLPHKMKFRQSYQMKFEAKYLSGEFHPNLTSITELK